MASTCICAIAAAQQAHALRGGVSEMIHVAEILDSAVAIQSVGPGRGALFALRLPYDAPATAETQRRKRA